MNNFERTEAIKELQHWKGLAAAANRGTEKWRQRYLDLDKSRNDLVAFWENEAGKYRAAMVDFADQARALQKELDRLNTVESRQIEDE